MLERLHVRPELAAFEAGTLALHQEEPWTPIRVQCSTG